MRSLLESIELLESEAIGAYQLWHFASAYRAASKAAPSVVLLMVAMGILNDRELSRYFKKLRNHIKNLRPNMKADKASDVFATLTQKVKANMAYTAKAIDVNVGAGLFRWDYDTATLQPLKARTTGPQEETRMLSEDALALGKEAEHLGKLFATYGDEHKLVSELGVKL